MKWSWLAALQNYILFSLIKVFSFSYECHCQFIQRPRPLKTIQGWRRQYQETQHRPWPYLGIKDDGELKSTDGPENTAGYLESQIFYSLHQPILIPSAHEQCLALEPLMYLLEFQPEKMQTSHCCYPFIRNIHKELLLLLSVQPSPLLLSLHTSLSLRHPTISRAAYYSFSGESIAPNQPHQQKVVDFFFLKSG